MPIGIRRCPKIVESFNARLRDELFNREIFHSVFEARVLLRLVRRLQQLPTPQLARLLGAGDVRRAAPRQVAIAGTADAMIASKPLSTTVSRKSDALRSLRTPGTKSPRPTTPGQPSSDETYNPFGRVGVGTRRRRSSPLVSELRNPHRGWIRFRGPV